LGNEREFQGKRRTGGFRREWKEAEKSATTRGRAPFLGLYLLVKRDGPGFLSLSTGDPKKRQLPLASIRGHPRGGKRVFGSGEELE